jgi:hypothetical protein
VSARTYYHEQIRCRLDSAPTQQFAALQEAIGMALEDEQQNGGFSFEDDEFGQLPALFYRVVTH